MSADRTKIALGQTFLVLAEGGHLWVVVTPPFGPEGDFIMVNMTTLRSSTRDRSCLLDVGDHPFIRHATAIFYGDAREWHAHGDNGLTEWFLDERSN